VLVATWGRSLPAVVVTLVAVVLALAVLAAVHHAEVVAHRVGEPFGSLVLAVAVTIIEVALIVTLMVSGGDKSASLARDTVFAAVMITCNGILGLSLLVSAVRFGMARFNAEGTGAALATVATVATLSLVLPTFTTTRPARLRGGGVPRPLRSVRVGADRPAPRLLPARDLRGDRCGRRGPRRAAYGR
jgi:Ca2+:H+ antiporter